MSALGRFPAAVAKLRSLPSMLHFEMSSVSARIATGAQQRFGGSVYTNLPGRAPDQQLTNEPVLTLYDYEASPYCRRVRQCLSDLQLTARVRPCPRSTLLSEGEVNAKHRFRGEAAGHYESLGLPLRFPLLVDQTGGGEARIIPESKAILRHLWREYGHPEAAAAVEASLASGDGRGERLAPWIPGSRTTRLRNAVHLLADADLLGHMLGTVLRPVGVFLAPGVLPASSSQGEPEIHLWGHEACPWSRLLREALCRLQLPYTLHSQGLEEGPRITIRTVEDMVASNLSFPLNRATLPAAITHLKGI